jgi:hypothetical protein
MNQTKKLHNQLRYWTSEEDTILRNSVEKGLLNQDIQFFLPHRTENAIRQRKAKFKMKDQSLLKDQLNLNLVCKVKDPNMTLLDPSLKCNMAMIMKLQDFIDQGKTKLELYSHFSDFTPKEIRKQMIVLKHYKVMKIFADDLFHCWLAGFFLADGYLRKERKLGSFHLSIKDYHLLKAIKDFFDYEKKSTIQIYEKSCKLYLPTNIVYQLCTIFQISAYKSFGEVCFPWFLSLQNQKAFLLGVYYGDGCANIVQKKSIKTSKGFNLGDSVHSVNKTALMINFLQTKNFCEQLLIFVQKQAKLFIWYDNSIIQKIQTQKSNYDLYKISFYGYEAFLLLQWLAEEEILKKIPPLDRKIKRVLNLSCKPTKASFRTAIKMHVTRNGRRSLWTKEELDQLKNFCLFFPHMTDEEKAKKLGRSLRSIRHKRYALGFVCNQSEIALKNKKPNLAFSIEEKTLIDFYLKTTQSFSLQTYEQLAFQLNQLPDRIGKPKRTSHNLQIYVKRLLLKSIQFEQKNSQESIEFRFCSD